MIYYCSSTGCKISNNDQVQGDFLYTLDHIKDGDTIILKSGEYLFHSTINICLSNIVLIGEGQVVFNFREVPYVCGNEYYSKDPEYYIENGNGINIYGNHCYFKNISIRYAAFRGLQNFGNFNTFENIETSYNCDCGNYQRGNDNIIKNCISHHNIDYKLIRNGRPQYGFNSDGFADKLHNGNGNKFIDCLSYYNGDDGFDFFQRETPKDRPTIVYNCEAYRNGLPMDLSSNERLKEDCERELHDIERWPCMGNGNGFKLGGIHKKTKQNDPQYVNRHWINIECSKSYENLNIGFIQNNNLGRIVLKECESYNNGKKDISFSKEVKPIIINCKFIKND